MRYNEPMRRLVLDPVAQHPTSEREADACDFFRLTKEEQNIFEMTYTPAEMDLHLRENLI